MIPFASQRGGGQDLATHLQNDYDNDLVEVDQVRGSIARDLHGAFKEWEVQAQTLTKCEKYLYSLSINPDKRQGVLTKDQYLDYINRTEHALGLSNQPRAIVFHVKEGREHCHVVWSRIDAERGKAVHIAFDKDKLMQVTRSFARDHGLRLPAGYEKSRKVGQESLYERALQRQTGFTKADHKRDVTEAWKQSDSPKAFVQALAERGYLLATGKRPYVLVDTYGGMHYLPRLIDDKAVKTKQVQAFLGKTFPKESLPSVEEARALIAAHRKFSEKTKFEDRLAERQAQLKHAQAERRKSVEQKREVLTRQHQKTRLEQQSTHRAERDRLRSDHIRAMKAIRLERYQNRPTGLAAFLGKVTGVALIQKKLHRVQDARKLNDHLDDRRQLKVRQLKEQKTLELRFKLQAGEMDRKVKSLEKIDKREVAALSRDNTRDQRVRARGDGQTMPSLENIAELEGKDRENDAPDLMRAFAQAKQVKQKDAPDLMAAFERAAKSRDDDDKDSGASSGLDKAKPPDFGMREPQLKNVIENEIKR